MPIDLVIDERECGSKSDSEEITRSSVALDQVPPPLSLSLSPPSPPGYSPILGHSSYLHNDSELLHSIHRNEEIGNNVAIIGPLRPEPGSDPGRLAAKSAATKLTRFVSILI